MEPGRAYCKGPTRWILPLYGRERVDRFMEWVRVGGRWRPRARATGKPLGDKRSFAGRVGW